METMGHLLAGLTGLLVLICHIVLIVKMFQNGQTGLGILTLVLTCCFGTGFLITLIYGWVKVGQLNIQTLMIVYTAAFILYWVGYAMAPPDIEAIRKQMGQ